MLHMDTYQRRMMRETQEGHFEDTCTIKRLTRTADGKGGFTTPAADIVATAVPCSFSHTAQLVVGGQADRGLEVEKWIVTLPWGTDVQDADILELDLAGVQVQVEDAKVSKTRGTAVRCTAEDVKGLPW